MFMIETTRLRPRNRAPATAADAFDVSAFEPDRSPTVAVNVYVTPADNTPGAIISVSESAKVADLDLAAAAMSAIAPATLHDHAIEYSASDAVEPSLTDLMAAATTMLSAAVMRVNEAPCVGTATESATVGSGVV